MTLTDDERRLLAASATALINLAEGLQIIINNMEAREPAEETNTSNLLTAGGFPQNKPSAPQTIKITDGQYTPQQLQDIDSSRHDYSRGLSGRI